MVLVVGKMVIYVGQELFTVQETPKVMVLVFWGGFEETEEGVN
jgi:hypothetical protein